MPRLITPSTRQRGITVLGLLLLIIALIVAAVFLIRYLRSRPVAAVQSTIVIPSPSLRSGQAPRGI